MSALSSSSMQPLFQTTLMTLPRLVRKRLRADHVGQSTSLVNTNSENLTNCYSYFTVLPIDVVDCYLLPCKMQM